MELAVRIHVEQLPEGLYLATSEDVQGLVVQGRTVAETLEFARDAAKKLIEARREREGESVLPSVANHQDFTIVVGA
jgi:predicted RNase H-like HicB family nuclease